MSSTVNPITAIKFLGERIIRTINVCTSLSEDVAALRAEVARLSARVESAIARESATEDAHVR